MKTIRLLIAAICFFYTPYIFSEGLPETYIEVSPEVSYGVHDNGPAWLELIPARGNLQISRNTSLSGEFGYAYEIDRDKKPFGPANHYGWRIRAKLEHVFYTEASFFYEINVGTKVPGTLNDIQYLQMENYQRIGIIWRLWKII